MTAKPRLAILSIIGVLIIIGSLALAGPAFATTFPAYTISTPGGGDCSLIGAWDAGTSTCTLNKNVNVSSGDAIEIGGDSITLDGAGHSIAGGTGSGSAIVIDGHSGNTVRNLATDKFSNGVLLNNAASNSIVSNNVHAPSNAGVYIVGSHGNQIANNTLAQGGDGVYLTSSSYSNSIFGNNLSLNLAGIGISTSSSTNVVLRNTIVGGLTPANTGVSINSSNNNSVYENNFEKLINYVTVTAGTTGNHFYNVLTNSGNYWDNFTTVAQGCTNNGFDFKCDAADTGIGSGFTDSYPYVLPDAWGRFDWTWYDNVNGMDWVLMSNTTSAISDAWYRLLIGNNAMGLAPLAGQAYGQVPAGKSLYAIYDSLMTGPVTAVNIGGDTSHTISSQRSLWPRGGSSMEEVTGTKGSKTYFRFSWPYYDMTNGLADWIMIENPNDYTVSYDVEIGGLQKENSTIAAHDKRYITYPNIKGGPVVVNASVGSAHGVPIIASQRVLSNGGLAFNEMPGIAQSDITSSYMWTWYDSIGATDDEIAIGNYHSTGIYYRVTLGGTQIATGGPVAGNSTAFVSIPGQRGGPLRVDIFSDAGLTTATTGVVSQRVVWGPSFEEVPGVNSTNLPTNSNWTWYDWQSPGSLNWVLVANPGVNNIQYSLKINGQPEVTNKVLHPGESDFPAFPGLMGGPVEVTATGPVLASQRVLWNNYFNEVLGVPAG